MSSTATKRSNSRKGNSAVEFALAVPVFVAMVFGAVDFGRMFFEAVVSQSAAGVGSLYGSQSMKFVGDQTGILTAAQTEAEDVSDVSTSVEVVCQCPISMTDFRGGQIIDCSNECANGYGAPRVYVRTRVQKAFKTFGWYPGVPRQVGIDTDGWIRVQ